MNVYAISDLHLSINNPKPMNIFGAVWDDYLDSIKADWLDKVKDDDVVLMAGDLSWAMQLNAAIPDFDFFGELPGKKVIIRGNHDYWWKSVSAVRAALPTGAYAVQNDALDLGGLVVCGSRGWTTPEGKSQSAEDKKIYEREIIRMRMSLEAMAKIRGDKKVVAMIHYPPFNGKYERSVFTEMFAEFKVDAVVYGHLHGEDSRTSPIVEIGGIGYYLTSCDRLGNRLAKIDI